MTQTQEFDLHASIKRLAEAEWPCPARLHILNAEDGSHLLCQACGSAGAAARIAPFAALRRSCAHRNAPYDCDCQGRGWVPEPDVEKAEFRCLLVLARVDLARAQGVLADMGVTGTKGLALRAAEAWMEAKP